MTGRPRAAGVLLLVLLGVAAGDATWRASAAPETGVARAPERLADTGLYDAVDAEVIDSRNRAFAPQYPLWSDGAAKSRWVYLPPGTAIDARDAAAWDFPVGTKFWKEFRFSGRKVETRLLWKVTRARWIAASYVWNEDGTDATLVPEQGLAGVAEVAPGRRHSIPSVADCFTCHGGTRPRPLGFTALQLSPDRDPNAIHGEALQPGMVTLQTLSAEGLLTPRRSSLMAPPPRIAASDPHTRAVLGYLSANCGSCHSREGDVPAVAPFLKMQDLLANGDAVARDLADRITTWQGPGHAEGATRLVDTTTPDQSAILLRMRSRRPSTQMPPLGTVLRDDAAVDAVREWIAGAGAGATQTERRALPEAGAPAPMR